jgi:hypothetical protein
MLLQADPLNIDPEVKKSLLMSDRRCKPWSNWEFNDVFDFWFGRHTSDDFFLTAMGAPQTPRPGDTVAPQWDQVSRQM